MKRRQHPPGLEEDLLPPFHGYEFSGHNPQRANTRSYMLSALRACEFLFVPFNAWISDALTIPHFDGV